VKQSLEHAIFANRKMIMRRTWIAVCLGLVVLIGRPVPARAEVYIRVPFFSFTVGPRYAASAPRVAVHVPFFDFELRRPVRVVNPCPPVAVAETPVPSAAPPKYDRVQPPPPEPVPALVRPPSISEFAGSFRPAPGSYEAVVIHPMTKAAVKVRFTLPAGTPRKVRVRRRELVFDYGRHSVRLRFVRDGQVNVAYR
jgi:hypothetical protein